MLHLFALGELRLETAAGQVLSRRRKPLVLLTYLARRAPRPASRVELAALLWGERPEAKARQSLRQALLELHRLVGDGLQVTSEHAQLTSDVLLDAQQFEDDVEAGRDREAIARWAGGFCAGAEEAGETAFRAWADAEQAGLQRRLTLAFERLLDDAARRGDARDALATARQWAALAPYDERACLHLVTALRREGRAVDALALHASFVTRMAEERGTTPSRAFLQLATSLDQSARTPPARPASDRPGETARESRAPHPFVGRAGPFSVLSAAWSGARQGTPSIAVVRAARGMGATHLCDELIRWVRDAKPATTILAVGGSEAGSRTPLSDARFLLRPLQDAPALGGMSPEMLASLAGLLPDLGRRFPHLPPRETRSEVAADDAVREALDAVADDAPVLLIVDRIDGVDAETRALVLGAARGLKGGVLVILVAGPSPGALLSLERSLAGGPTIEALVLDPLSSDHVHELLRDACSLPEGEARALARELQQQTGGAPGLVVPVIDAMLADGALTRRGDRAAVVVAPSVAEMPIPPAVRQWVAARREALPDAARRVLDAAAVHGPALSHGAAEALCDLPPAAVADAVEQLATDALVVASSDGTVAVHPPIVERAVYESVPALRREALHATAATLEPRASRWSFRRRTPARHERHLQRGGLDRRSTIGRTWSIAAVALLVMLGAVGAVAVWRRPVASPTARAASVAIFPFSVAGDTNLGYLGAGMVDMLTASLDGAAGLRTIDPRAVIAAIDRAPAAPPLRPDEARALAERLGARYFVLGNVIGASDRLEVSANLYETSDADAVISRARASGGGDALFDIVDRVTAQLAVAHGARSGERLTQLAGVTTTSLPALKAYLEARSAYRDNDLYAALPAYQRAVAADSTFALAWYGLASTASWMLRPTVEQHAAAQAVRFGERLSPRERTLFDAFAAYSRGHADSAERMATTLAETYDDVEAWVLVGEVLYHHNWKRGRSAVESRRAWERVLALDARYWPALQHLAEVAAMEGNDVEADSLLARYERSVGAEHMMLASRALRAHAFGDERARQAIAPQLAADRGFWVILSVWYVGVAGRDLDAAQQLARLLVQPLRPPAQQGFGRVLLAHLALARGRWREAQAELAIARAHAPGDALEHQLMLALAPHVASPPATIRALQAELARQPAAVAEPASTIPWPRPPVTLDPTVRAYLDGMSSARTGDGAGRSRALARIAAAPSSGWLGDIQTGFASSIQAEHERVNGRPEAALLAFERGARPSPFVAAWTSSFVAQAYERYQRAELLHQLKRDDEALRWYGTFAENSPYDLVYLAPAIYRQAQILDGRGDRRRAVERYARFVELWKDADPELQPFVATARTRLAQLQ